MTEDNMVDDKTSTDIVGTTREKSRFVVKAELFVDSCDNSVAELYANLGLSWLNNYLNKFFKSLGIG
jgi:hypothetical protein